MASLSVPVNENDHSSGSNDASVTLVEYGDYQCPYCGRAYPIVKKIQETMGDRLHFVFRNFPLSQIHPHAFIAAEAAEAAAAQGKFWEMHDIIFENQTQLDDASLVEYANTVGLDVEKFVADMQNGTYAEKVKADFLSGVESGVNGTPTFFINGERFNGSWDYETLLATLENIA